MQDKEFLKALEEAAVWAEGFAISARKALKAAGKEPKVQTRYKSIAQSAVNKRLAFIEKKLNQNI